MYVGGTAESVEIGGDEMRKSYWASRGMEGIARWNQSICDSSSGSGFAADFGRFNATHFPLDWKSHPISTIWTITIIGERPHRWLIWKFQWEDNRENIQSPWPRSMELESEGEVDLVPAMCGNISWISRISFMRLLGSCWKWRWRSVWNRMNSSLQNDLQMIAVIIAKRKMTSNDQFNHVTRAAVWCQDLKSTYNVLVR